MNTLLLLIISTTAPATDNSELIAELRDEHPELFTAPALQEWPDGLPASAKTPLEGICRDHMGREFGGEGTWIPQATARVVEARLLLLEEYPARSQAVIDALTPDVVNAVVAKVESTGHDTSTVVLWAAVGIVVGGIIAGSAAVALTD